MQLAPRPCPMCGARTSRTLLSLTGRAIFRANWSYRPEALDEIGDLADAAFPIGQCADCAFVFAPQLPSDEFLAFVYERAIDADKAREQNLSAGNLVEKMRALPTLFALAPPARPLRVLDWGCGFGPNLQVLSSLPSVEAVGFETSPARLDHLARRSLRAVGDRDALAAFAPFGAVLIDNVLEHLPDPRESLAFIRGLCAHEAIVFVGVPDVSADELRRIGAHGGAVRMDVNPWEHLNYFDAPHLDALMRRTGFAPLSRSQLPASVEIGLRPSSSATARVRNAAASALRLLRYAATGDVLPQVTARFYRAV